MSEPHDFDEHGRLHLLRDLCGELEDRSVMQHFIRIMDVRHSLEPAVEEAERIVAAYRAVVQEADYFIKIGSGEAKVRLRAALAAFKNIGGAP